MAPDTKPEVLKRGLWAPGGSQHCFCLPILEEKHNVMNMFNLLKPTGYVMHQQFNIQQLYVLPTLYLCVLYLSENKQRLVPLTA